MTQEKVAERVGKSRAAVANHLRLLKLPAQVQMALQKKEIDMGHARALLAIDSPSQQLRVFREIQKNGYSVRQVETLVKKINEGTADGDKRPAKKQQTVPEGFAAMREKLAEMFSSKVEMTCSAKGKGKITIPFGSEEELERIMGVFGIQK
jgi:ParB family chromosome partitioning protein